MASETPVQGQRRMVCPSCGTVVTSKSRCGKCGLEVDKMRAFAAAKAAAERKGIRAVEVERETPTWRKPGTIVGVLLLVGLVVGIMAMMHKPPAPPWWSGMPVVKQTLAEEFLGHIATGKDEGYVKAYGLIARDETRPVDREEVGQYRQLYHEMNKYLAGEFGEEWARTAEFIEDPANPNVLVVKVGLETLHVEVQQVTPADKVGSAGQHWAIVGVHEFPLSMAINMQSNEAQRSIIGSMAGQGALNNLDTIIGARGLGPRLSPIERKIKLLPILRNPRSTVRATVIQAWPLRKDAVVRGRLQQIMEDGRYPRDVQLTAKEVLDEKVDETDLVAAGVAE